MEILERDASAEGRTEYRRFVVALADAAGRAARRSGLLGRRRQTPTDSGRDALRAIAAILDR